MLYHQFPPSLTSLYIGVNPHCKEQTHIILIMFPAYPWKIVQFNRQIPYISRPFTPCFGPRSRHQLNLDLVGFDAAITACAATDAAHEFGVGDDFTLNDRGLQVVMTAIYSSHLSKLPTSS
jgi:hypothetical protein